MLSIVFDSSAKQCVHKSGLSETTLSNNHYCESSASENKGLISFSPIDKAYRGTKEQNTNLLATILCL